MITWRLILKKKRQAIDVKLKNEIIQKSSNKTTSESAKEYGLALSTISTIINPTNKAKISKLLEFNQITDKCKSLKSTSYPDIEEALILWFTNIKKLKNITVSGIELQAKALEFAQKFKHPEFMASCGWLACFSSRKINKTNLPVFNRNNTKAWMDGEIFAEWLSILNKKFSTENINILLFLDNLRGHKVESYSNIAIKFNPVSCKSVIQPLDQGIIKIFKVKYRTSLVQEKLKHLDNKMD